MRYGRKTKSRPLLDVMKVSLATQTWLTIFSSIKNKKMTHIKILTAIAEFLDKHYAVMYEIEGYFGTAHLTIGDEKYTFDLINDKVVVTKE